MLIELTFSRKSLAKSERSDRFQQEKKMKEIIQHVAYSIKLCKIVLLVETRTEFVI